MQYLCTIERETSVINIILAPAIEGMTVLLTPYNLAAIRMAIISKCLYIDDVLAYNQSQS